MDDRAAELFVELKSESRPRDHVRQMSGGQRQAVAIADTRLSDPKLVLIDGSTAAIKLRQVAFLIVTLARYCFSINGRDPIVRSIEQGEAIRRRTYSNLNAFFYD